ncbi:MAG: hypothetical protein HXY53_04965 [Nitrospirae bacterium]|nr:hypothetical protein [Nitrospirota bacterium]
MQKKLTITIDEEVYEDLHKAIGSCKISQFVEKLVRPHVVRPNLELAYSQMSKDKKREEAFKFLNRVQIIPLTSKTDRLYPSKALIIFNGKESKAMADQLAIVSKLRFLNVLA